MKTIGYGAPSEMTLQRVLTTENATRRARYAGPRLGSLGLETDFAAFTLVDAVAQVVSACNPLEDREYSLLPALDGLVDRMNDLFLGKTYAHRTASLFGSAINDLVPQRAWAADDDVISADTIFRVFQDGKDAVTFQQLAVRNNAMASLRDIANLPPKDIQDLYGEYMSAAGHLLFKDGRPPSENFERYSDQLCRLIKESAMLRVIHCMGGKTLVSFAKQKASSIPQEVFQRIIDSADFTSAQITQIWNLWYDCLRVMLHLKPQEQQLHSEVQRAVQDALRSPGMAANSVLLRTAADLKRNLEAQATAIFTFNSHATMRVLTPLQATKMHVAAAPYFTRFHLLFLSGLFPRLS